MFQTLWTSGVCGLFVCGLQCLQCIVFFFCVACSTVAQAAQLPLHLFVFNVQVREVTHAVLHHVCTNAHAHMHIHNVFHVCTQ